VASLVVEIAAAVEHSLAAAVETVAVAAVDSCDIGRIRAPHRCASRCDGQAVGSASEWVVVVLEDGIVPVKLREGDRGAC
jgi:hypothetical protein